MQSYLITRSPGSSDKIFAYWFAYLSNHSCSKGDGCQSQLHPLQQLLTSGDWKIFPWELWVYDYLSGAPGDGAIRYPPFLFGIFETPWTDLHPHTPKNRHPARVHEGQVELTVEYAWLIVFNDRLDFNDVGSFHVDVSDGWTECHDMDHSRPSRLPMKNKLQFIPPNPQP